MRFELTAYALNPNIKVIAPWREWEFKSRTDLIDFAEKNQIPVAKDKRGEAPFSVDANLLHSSSEGKVLEDPGVEPPPYVFQRTVAPEDAPDKATDVEIGFKKGDAVSIDGKALSPATLLTRLNELGRDNGIGRVDLVENRFVGMKIARHLRDAGRHDPLRRAPRHRIAHARPRGGASEGLADAALCRARLLRLLVLAGARDAAGAGRQEPGACRGQGPAQALQGQRHRHRPAQPKSLYSDALVTFEDDRGAYDQKDAAGFIRLNALRLRLLGKRARRQELRAMWPDTRLLDLFGMELPIMQAPMANSTRRGYGGRGGGGGRARIVPLRRLSRR